MSRPCHRSAALTPIVALQAALTREPYAAILEHYVQNVTRCHTCILERIVDWPRFQEHALQQAHYWAQGSEAQVRCVLGTSVVNSYSCGGTFLGTDLNDRKAVDFDMVTPARLFKLEDLMLAAGREDHLRALLAFVGLKVDDERVACAYEHMRSYQAKGPLTVTDAFCSDKVSSKDATAT